MRVIQAQMITNAVRMLCAAVEKQRRTSDQNAGLICVFLEIGQELHVQGSIAEAVNQGAQQRCKKGGLNQSCIEDPIQRTNIADHESVMIYYELVMGDSLKITVAPRSFDSENRSQLSMFPPSAGVQGIKEFVLKVVEEARSDVPLPLVVGVGIGSTFDKVALLAEKALLRNPEDENPSECHRILEQELLAEINQLGNALQGDRETMTALCVQVETLGTHIGSLPVAVALNGHEARHRSLYL